MQNGKRRERCDTMPGHWELLEVDPEYRERRLEVERQTRAWERQYGMDGARTGVVVLPVVVHVVWNTAAQNVSAAQIQSQLDVLNADFRKLNADVANVPAAFAPLAADARIEFRLAARDPNCQPTNGITRTETSVTAFSPTDAVKSSATGGVNPWPNDRYVNIWVCNLPAGKLGKGSFPGTPAALDGIVIDVSAFGTTGTASDPFDGGRTATHEVGHFLNLNHIWGDDQYEADTCSLSDNVADTPNQAVARDGTPVFPQISCNNGPNGDMFMNYMDYVDDAAMFMFTAGQVTRMNATLNTARAALLGSSALVAPPAGGSAPDLWMADKPVDIGDEPDTLAAAMWESDDIWVRRQNDGIANQDHESPLHRPAGQPDNYVYVRVRNRSCGGSATGTLKLYWAKASTGLSWPSPWDGSVTSPALMGGVIGSQSVTVAGGGFQIVAFPWAPPDPDDYASFGADAVHFCLLARIETQAAAPFGMTFPETGDLYANVRNNNNVVWKNVSITDADPGAREAAVIVQAPTDAETDDERVRLVFDFPRARKRLLPEAVPALEFGRVLVDLGRELFDRWRAAGAEGDGYKHVDDETIEIVEPGAWIGDLELKRGELFVVRVTFEPHDEHQASNDIYFFDIRQLAVAEESVRLVGGQRFVLKTVYRPRKRKELDPVRTFDGAEFHRPRFAVTLAGELTTSA